jgi:hypothetical protein
MRLAVFSKLERPESIPISLPNDRENAAKLLGWERIHLNSPRWAVVQDSFAAAYGPLVSHYSME